MEPNDGFFNVPKRYIVVTLVFIGNGMLAILQTNLSINLVEMTWDKNVTIGNETRSVKADFDWNMVQKGYMVSIYSLGMIFTFLGGPVVYKFGGTITYGVAVILASFLTLSFSASMQTNSIFLFFLGRVLEGFLTGISYVAYQDIIVHWAPLNEHTRLTTVCWMGSAVGTALNYPLSGMIAHRFGWRAVFYFSGTVTFITGLIWLFIVRNDPTDDHMFISDAEKFYLKTQNKDITNNTVPVPWRQILTSRAVWAICNEYFIAFWCSSFILTGLPFYVKDMYNVDTETVGNIAALPVTCSLITMYIAAYIADYLRSNYFTPTQVHNMFIFWGNAIVVVLLFVTALWVNFTGSVICFCLMRMSFSFAQASYSVICIDMAGQFSAVIKGLVLTFSSTANLLNPVLMGYMVPNHSSSEYNRYFLFLGFISMYGVIVFVLFGSGDLQEWAVLPKKWNQSDSNTTKLTATYNPNSEVLSDPERLEETDCDE